MLETLLIIGIVILVILGILALAGVYFPRRSWLPFFIGALILAVIVFLL